jgi:hypothetical protein
MSADRQTILYHLVSTPTLRWIVARDDSSVPVDRLVSFELEIYQGSPFGRESRHWKRVGHQDGLTDNQIAELVEKHPKPARASELSAEGLAELTKDR